MFFVGFKAPSFLHIFAIRKMKSRTPEPELTILMNPFQLNPIPLESLSSNSELNP